MIKSPIQLCIPEISNHEIETVSKVFKTGWLAHGEWNKKFENSFARYIGSKYAISMNSCTSALEIALKINDIKKEVIIPSMTWCATANAVVNVGAKPVFCEVDPKTRNVTAETIIPHITKRTEAIIIVHFGGQVCDMGNILKLVNRKKLVLIEDSAETLGGDWQGKKAGSFGIGCFSFFPTKNITTGEGGMLTINNKSLADKARALIGHGIKNSTHDREKKKIPWLREADFAGHNYRMPNPLAALGFSQLKKVDTMNKKRISIANRYNKNLMNNEYVTIPFCNKNIKHVYQMYTVEVDKKYRDALVNFLRTQKIMSSVHFYPPVHKQSYYKKIYKNLKLRITEELSLRLVTLPIYPSLELKKVDYICNQITKFFNENA